jgi:hypothetical protein
LSLTAGAAASTITTVTCPAIGTFDRQMTFTNAEMCYALGPVTGTPRASDVEELFGGEWFDAGHLAGADGTSGWLGAEVTSGSWGSIPAVGTWMLEPELWALYPRAVVSFHLGNGSGNPDWFFFEVTPGATSGTWSIAKLSGAGGGLSNIVLWADQPADDSMAAVPEPATLLLMGAGLGLVATVLRRRRRGTSA